ncbi:MAG: discoidin domain-containing protein, partial [Limisphaerales bacterium]
MLNQLKPSGRSWLASLTAGLLLGLTGQAQTTPNVQVEILGEGAEALLGFGATPETPTGPLTDPEGDGLDALEAATDPSWNWVGITASIEPDFEGGENSFNIFDHKVGGGNDKWCCDDPTPDNPVWVAVQFAQAYTLTHFTVTSGNDSPDRDPTDWAIQGSNNGESWTDIYHFTDTVVPWDARNQVVKFTLPPGLPPYSYFRYIAYETPGTLHQLNEIEYFGTAGAQVDTDNDGMPDSYEIEKGFNPNDPADAALDFDGDGVSNLDEYKAGTDPIDTTKPTVVSVVSTRTLDTVLITFSEELDPATAVVTANYTITPALAVTAATYNRKVVTLTTAAQTPGGTAYTVAVAGVRDTSKNEVPAGTQGTFFSYMLTQDGVLKFSYWGGIPSASPVSLLFEAVDAEGNLRYPASPDWTGAVFSFNSRDILPTDVNDNYAAVMEGFLTPTESGDYRFFIYSDDASQLYLSANAT